MNPDCPYCWLKDGANIDHICDVVNVKKNLDTQWEITAETQRHLERCINSKNTEVEKARRQQIEIDAKNYKRLVKIFLGEEAEIEFSEKMAKSFNNLVKFLSEESATN